MEDKKKEKMKIFEKENRVYKYYLNRVEDKKESVEFIKDLFKLELLNSDKSENLDLIKLYNIVGFDKFFEIISCFGSQSIRIPNSEKIKKNLTLSIAYYYTVMLGVPAKEVGHLLSEKLGVFNLKQKSIKSLVNKMQAELETLAKRVSEKAKEDESVGE